MTVDHVGVVNGVLFADEHDSLGEDLEDLGKIGAFFLRLFSHEK